MAISDQLHTASPINPSCDQQQPELQVRSLRRTRHNDARVHRTVKIDGDTDRELQRLVEIVPILSVHACHLACLRAGLAAIKADPGKLMAYLTDHKVRVSSSREV